MDDWNWVIQKHLHKQVRGELVGACLNPPATELACLVRFKALPEGPHMRLQTLRLLPDDRGWNKLKILFPLLHDSPEDAQPQPLRLADASLAARMEGLRGLRPRHLGVARHLWLEPADVHAPPPYAAAVASVRNCAPGVT